MHVNHPHHGSPNAQSLRNISVDNTDPSVIYQGNWGNTAGGDSTYASYETGFTTEVDINFSISVFLVILSVDLGIMTLYGPYKLSKDLRKMSRFIETQSNTQLNAWSLD